MYGEDRKQIHAAAEKYGYRVCLDTAQVISFIKPTSTDSHAWPVLAFGL